MLTGDGDGRPVRDLAISARDLFQPILFFSELCISCRCVASCCPVVITRAQRYVTLVRVLRVLALASKPVLVVKPVSVHVTASCNVLYSVYFCLLCVRTCTWSGWYLRVIVVVVRVVNFPEISGNIS